VPYQPAIPVDFAMTGKIFRRRPAPDESWSGDNGMLLLTFNPVEGSPLTDSPAVAKVSGPKS
jgi:hypothetical protein